MSSEDELERQQLERLYLPSNWSKRYGGSAEQLLARYMDFCRDTTARVRGSVEHELDVPYGPSERSKYDVYGTDLPRDAPILLFIHGGYWQEFSKDLSGFAVPSMLAHGIKVVVAGYDLCPNVRLSDIVRQTKQLAARVLRWARSSGSRCVWIAGHSAGAHLAASLLHDRAWLDECAAAGDAALLRGLVLVSGIYALEPLVRVDSVNRLLRLSADEIESFTFAPLPRGGGGGGDEDAAPNYAVKNIKVLLAVGECDSPVFIEESRRYTKRLANLVDNVEFLLIRGNTDHFDIVENLTKKDFCLSKTIVNYINMTNGGGGDE